MTKDISIDWLRLYLSSLIVMAKAFGEGTVMEKAALMRADHVMDVIQAWDEHCKGGASDHKLN